MGMGSMVASPMDRSVHTAMRNSLLNEGHPVANKIPATMSNNTVHYDRYKTFQEPNMFRDAPSYGAFHNMFDQLLRSENRPKNFSPKSAPYIKK